MKLSNKLVIVNTISGDQKVDQKLNILKSHIIANASHIITQVQLFSEAALSKLSNLKLFSLNPNSYEPNVIRCFLNLTTPDFTKIYKHLQDIFLPLLSFAIPAPIILNSHTNTVCTVALTDSLIISSGWDCTIKLWDIFTHRLLRTLTGHTKRVISVSPTSSASNLLISGSWDKTIRIWNLSTFQTESSLLGHTKGIVAMAVSGNDQYIASGSIDTTVRLWGVQSRKIKFVMVGHVKTVEAVVFTYDFQYLISGGGDCTVIVWNVRTGDIVNLLKHTSIVVALAVSSDGILVSGCWDATIWIWRVKTWNREAVLKGHTDSVWAVAFTKDNKWIITVSWDKTVRVWSMKSRKQVQEFRGHTKSVRSVAVNANIIVSASADFTVRVWDIAESQWE